MPSPRPRRIVRRAVMVLAVVVLLLSGYFGAWLGFCFAASAGLVPPWAGKPAQEFWAPLHAYVFSDYPGAQTARDMGSAALSAGRRAGSRLRD